MSDTATAQFKLSREFSFPSYRCNIMKLKSYFIHLCSQKHSS